MAFGSSAGSSGASPTAASSSAAQCGGNSVVKFAFEKRQPKDLLIELELYDKVFLQKKDLCRLVGRTPLEELLPPSNSKLAQNVAHVTLHSADALVR
jgi:hypothetical protein